MRNKDTDRKEYTGGQLALNEMLVDLGFSTEMEVPFDPFRVDIYLHKEHVAIEYDGAHHMRKGDRRRDEYLLEHFKLPVLRLTRASPKETVKAEMISFISEWVESAAGRKPE